MPIKILFFCPSLGAFAKLRKATFSFVMSVRPHGTTLFPQADFNGIWYLSIFRKYLRKIEVYWKI